MVRGEVCSTSALRFKG